MTFEFSSYLGSSSKQVPGTKSSLSNVFLYLFSRVLMFFLPEVKKWVQIVFYTRIFDAAAKYACIYFADSHIHGFLKCDLGE